MDFNGMWAELQPVGRMPSGGYRRFAWTAADAALRQWFASAAERCGLAFRIDAAGNQWAWWGDPGRDGAAIVTGSHLDSVPDGGAFDGPLGIVSAFLAIGDLRSRGFLPRRPIAVVNFVEEEGARFGVACAGSRLLTGALPASRALALRDSDGVTLAEARSAAGQRNDKLGPDPETVGFIGRFVELHIEQGRSLARVNAPIGLACCIWPHGRWRVDFPGEANHAGTTALLDRRDAMLDYARFVVAARELAAGNGALATCGKVQVIPNGVTAIPAHVTGWLDVRAPSVDAVKSVVAELESRVAPIDGTLVAESWTDRVEFDAALRGELATAIGQHAGSRIPVLDTGAGHDAGVLAAAGVSCGMIFVRNPTGVSHSPAEYADRSDCVTGVAALINVLERLAS